ncbi:MAG: Rib/alpha-like domain-containing protein [Peptoniphilaceae bacterium]|nr:Rib/alpha-like domain-containing protein [Peptoniphilaceae bacterium]MDY6019192.1 Rib/alpha-like domain-containing protein [Anaerococcus sp.]
MKKSSSCFFGISEKIKEKIDFLLVDFLKKIAFSFLLFLSIFLVNVSPSYAQNNTIDKVNEVSNQRISFENLKWADDNYPVKLLSIEDVYTEIYNFNFKVDADISKKGTYYYNFYNSRGELVTFIEDYFKAPKINYTYEKTKSFDENKAKAGDILTMTFCPKDDLGKERIIGQFKIHQGPIFKDVGLNKGYNLKEDKYNFARLFVKNKNDLPKDTEYYFGDKLIVKDEHRALINVFVKLPSVKKAFVKQVKFFYSDYFIPLIENDSNTDVPYRYNKFIYDAGDHGRIMDGEIKEIFISHFAPVDKPLPEIIVDKGYRLIEWEKIKIDNNVYKLRAKYSKIIDDINLNDKSTYVSVKFLKDEDQIFDGNSEFNIPKGYSFSSLGQYEPPVVKSKKGAKFVRWDPNFDPEINLYKDTEFKAIFEDTMASTLAPIFKDNFIIEDGKEVNPRELIDNLDQLPEDIIVQWAKEPNFSQEGINKLMVNLIYPDNSRLWNVEFKINISFKEEENPIYPKEDDKDIEDTEEIDKPSSDKIDEELEDSNEDNNDKIDTNDDIDTSTNLYQQYWDDFYQKDQNLSDDIIMEIRIVAERLENKLAGVKFIKENMPQSYKRYSKTLDEAVARANESLKVAKEFLARYDNK